MSIPLPMKIEAAILDIIDKVENKKIGSFIYHCGKMLEQKDKEIELLRQLAASVRK